MQKSRRWIAPLLIGGVIVCVLSIPLGAKVMLNLVFPTAVPPTYSANEAARNCLFLPNADQQPFCRDLTRGDAVTFNQALKQSFPVGKATYVEIMKYFGHLQTKWYADLKCYEEDQKRVRVGTCPKPQFCKKGVWYTCEFTSTKGNFPEVSITVSFEMTGIVKAIGASGLPNNS